MNEYSGKGAAIDLRMHSMALRNVTSDKPLSIYGDTIRELDTNNAPAALGLNGLGHGYENVFLEKGPRTG